MGLLELALKIIFCLLVAGLLGWIIGFLLGRIYGSANATELLKECESKTRVREQELSGVRGDLVEATAKINSLQTEVATMATTLKTRDGWVTELEGKNRELQTDLDARISELDELKAESEQAKAALNAQLDEALTTGKAEAAALRAQADAATTRAKSAESEVASLRANFTSKEQELAQAFFRLKSLEPLAEQLEQREERIAALEAAAQTTRSAHEGELTALRAQLDDLRATHTAAQTNATELEAALQDSQQKQREWEAELASLRAGVVAKEAELTDLRAQFALLQPLGGQVKDREAELAQLEQRLNDLEPLSAQIAQRDEELTKLRARLNELEPLTMQVQENELRLSKLSAQAKSKEEELAALKTNLGDLESLRGLLADRDAEASQWRARLSELEAQVQQAQAQQGEIARLQQCLTEQEDSRQLVSERDSEIARLRLQISELEPLTIQVQQREARVRDLNAELQGKAAELAQLGNSLSERDAKYAALEREKEQELTRLKVRITELEMMAREVKEPAVKVSPASGLPLSPKERDDLKKVYGIGPVLEKLLNEHGVYWFRQIATWTAEDIQHYDALLEEFHGRIEREGWIASAREEHLKKYNEHL
jgi:predicted flap endonuclease-1-like 5' DNA nuclease